MMHNVCIANAENNEQLAEWLEELQRYRDLAEQGRLIELPCGIGTTVYEIITRYSKSYDEHKEHYIQVNDSVGLKWIVINLKEFGKTVFLTRAEAEAKLKELEG